MLLIAILIKKLTIENQPFPQLFVSSPTTLNGLFRQVWTPTDKISHNNLPCQRCILIDRDALLSGSFSESDSNSVAV